MSSPTHQNYSFTTALITGGAGGIGKALATQLIHDGKKVLIAGRTDSTLRSTCSEIGAAGYYVLDTGLISSIPSFIQKVIADHPDLDCLINNAGVQRPLDVNNDDAAIFGEKADNEIDINIRGPMHLTLHLLPHLRTKRYPLIVNISSVLGFVPFSIINPVYNGTKAWIHFWSMALREQLSHPSTTSTISTSTTNSQSKGEEKGGVVKVIEIAPPTVSTDLHRERRDPDDNKKEKNPNALSVDEFVQEVREKWMRGDEMIGAGMAAGIVEEWEGGMGRVFVEMVK